MIQVQVSLYATLRKYRPEIGHGQSFAVGLPAGSTVKDLLQELGIPQEEMKQTFVNGVIRAAEYRLADGDSVGVFPPIAGGRSLLSGHSVTATCWRGPCHAGGM